MINLSCFFYITDCYCGEVVEELIDFIFSLLLIFVKFLWVAFLHMNGAMQLHFDVIGFEKPIERLVE